MKFYTILFCFFLLPVYAKAAENSIFEKHRFELMVGGTFGNTVEGKSDGSPIKLNISGAPQVGGSYKYFWPNQVGISANFSISASREIHSISSGGISVAAPGASLDIAILELSALYNVKEEGYLIIGVNKSSSTLHAANISHDYSGGLGGQIGFAMRATNNLHAEFLYQFLELDPRAKRPFDNNPQNTALLTDWVLRFTYSFL